MDASSISGPVNSVQPSSVSSQGVYNPISVNAGGLHVTMSTSAGPGSIAMQSQQVQPMPPPQGMVPPGLNSPFAYQPYGMAPHVPPGPCYNYGYPNPMYPYGFQYPNAYMPPPYIPTMAYPNYVPPMYGGVGGLTPHNGLQQNHPPGVPQQRVQSTSPPQSILPVVPQNNIPPENIPSVVPQQIIPPQNIQPVAPQSIPPVVPQNTIPPQNIQSLVPQQIILPQNIEPVDPQQKIPSQHVSPVVPQQNIPSHNVPAVVPQQSLLPHMVSTLGKPHNEELVPPSIQSQPSTQPPSTKLNPVRPLCVMQGQISYSNGGQGDDNQMVLENIGAGMTLSGGSSEGSTQKNGDSPKGYPPNHVTHPQPSPQPCLPTQQSTALQPDSYNPSQSEIGSKNCNRQQTNSQSAPLMNSQEIQSGGYRQPQLQVQNQISGEGLMSVLMSDRGPMPGQIHTNLPMGSQMCQGQAPLPRQIQVKSKRPGGQMPSQIQKSLGGQGRMSNQGKHVSRQLTSLGDAMDGRNFHKAIYDHPGASQ